MNRENLAQLQQTIVHLKKYLSGSAVLIYCDEKRFIPDELSSLVYFLDVKPPSQDELQEIIDNFIRSKEWPELDRSLVYQLSAKCVGMNEDSFNQVLEKAWLEKEKDFKETVLHMADKTKKQFVDKSGLLKYVNVDVDLSNVGGLGHLQWWLRQKEKAIKEPQAAKEKGITPAKGILLVGMPGCGKSLTSKAVAGYFNYPMLQLDLGSLMGKYLGESEENLRRALKLAENSSPCVLWVDEIEKAFAGVGGDESGVSQRLFGYLLTWLNDKTAQVFVMATANDVAVLPPEFLRRGRFDEIFYVDFPNSLERKAIFKIHLGKVFGKEIVKGKKDEELKEILEKEKKTKEKYEEELGKEKIEELLKKEKFKQDFEELTRDKKPEETDTDAVVNNIEQVLRKREFYKEQLANRFGGKDKLDKIFSDEYSARKFEELTRDIKPIAQEKKVKEYPGTEGYAGSDIEALVNSAVERADKQGKKLEEEIFTLLLAEQKYMKPLKEVLAEKIARNREKFGEYKLTPAAENENDRRRFETDSEGTPKEQEEVAGDERCPLDILIKLAQKGTKEVKLAVLKNTNCPPPCISYLVGDADPDVKAKAEEKQSTTSEGIIEIAASEGKKEQKLRLLDRQGLSEEVLDTLAKAKDIEVIMKLLQYKPLPEKVLNRIVERAGSDEALREKIKDSNCPPEIKEKLERSCENCIFSRKKRSNPFRGEWYCDKISRLCNNVCSEYLPAGEKCCKNCRYASKRGNEYYCAKKMGLYYADDKCHLFNK
jgi:SpoVK/Ycf46/Vps4 family AAA+-type ATPase